MASIDYNDDHAPLFQSIALGHSCSGYPYLFQVRLQGRRHHRHRWRDKARRRDTSGRSRVTVTHITRTAPYAQGSAHTMPIDAFIRAPLFNTRNISLQSRTMCKMRGSVEVSTKLLLPPLWCHTSLTFAHSVFSPTQTTLGNQVHTGPTLNLIINTFPSLTESSDMSLTCCLVNPSTTLHL